MIVNGFEGVTEHLPHPRSLHFFLSLFSFFSPFVQVRGMQGHKGLLNIARDRANHSRQSALQSFGTHPRTGRFHHQDVNQRSPTPFSGISSGSSPIQSGLHQSNSQHSKGHISGEYSEGFGQHLTHHSLFSSKHCGGGYSGSVSPRVYGLHHSSDEHRGQRSES